MKETLLQSKKQINPERTHLGDLPVPPTEETCYHQTFFTGK